MSKNSNHMKRLTQPRTWSIPKKGKVWVPKTSPGKHGTQESLPVIIAIRDYLKICDNAKEAKKIIGQKDFLIDGKPATDEKAPLGLMDVVSIPKMKAYYRILLDKKGKIKIMSIKKEEALWKLVRVNDKTMIRGGKLQLNLHDGRNIIVQKDNYNTGDTLKLSIPDQKILERIPLEDGNLAFLTGGSHVGYLASIKTIEKTKNPKANIVHFNEEFSTHQRYVFVVGTDTTEIDIPEVVT